MLKALFKIKGGALKCTVRQWRLQLTLSRTGAGQPAMIWVDNITVKEGANFHFEEEFPLGLGDLNGDGFVGVGDMLLLFASWGPCADCDDCPADLNGDCTVGVADLLLLFANWG